MGEQSLRDALADLAINWSNSSRPGSTLFTVSATLHALLADHPAEPAPVVTDEAVEAVAGHFYTVREIFNPEFKAPPYSVVAEQLLGRLNGSGVDSSLHTCPGCGVKVIGHERCGDPTRPECAS